MNTPVEIIGLVRDSTLLGAAVLYLDRSGEIAFFVREKGKGYGSKLLKAIENVAREKGLRKVWARVLKNNHKAIRAFLKNGYKIVKTTREKHVNSTVFLIYFEKKLNLRNSGGFK
jgi:RimJ/RimL family protein N-acetyltransferase